MNTRLFIRRITFPALLATVVVLGAACKKETTPEPTYSVEETVYATAQDQVLTTQAIFYAPIIAPGFSSTDPVWYDIEVRLAQSPEEKLPDQWIRRDTLFTRQTFSPARIVGIDLVTDNDYDAQHPAGSSLADLFSIPMIGMPAFGFEEFFDTFGPQEWYEGTVLRFTTRTLPTPSFNNERFFDRQREKSRRLGAVLRLTLEDGTTLELRPTLHDSYYKSESVIR